MMEGSKTLHRLTLQRPSQAPRRSRDSCCLISGGKGATPPSSICRRSWGRILAGCGSPASTPEPTSGFLGRRAFEWRVRLFGVSPVSGGQRAGRSQPDGRDSGNSLRGKLRAEYREAARRHLRFVSQSTRSHKAPDQPPLTPLRLRQTKASTSPPSPRSPPNWRPRSRPSSTAPLGQPVPPWQGNNPADGAAGLAAHEAPAATPQVHGRLPDYPSGALASRPKYACSSLCPKPGSVAGASNTIVPRANA